MRNWVFKTKDDELFMVRCPECEQENHAMVVATGQCAWCGYRAKETDLEKKDHFDENFN